MSEMPQPLSRRMLSLYQPLEPLVRFMTESPYSRRAGQPGICDFAVGNPHEMPLPGFVEALQRHSVPQRPDWYGYKENEPEAQRVVAESLARVRGLEFAAEDIILTNGAFAALAVVLTAVVDPGDEVIFISPPWFFYEALIAAAGAVPVRVKVAPETFDLDLAAIGAAITPRTRAIIVNSPNNPTGRIYTPALLQDLAGLLQAAGERNGRPIMLLSDEAYSRIVFDGRACPSPTAYYPCSFLIYTYGKTLLTPGQRLGYVAVPPAMPGREALRNGLLLSQILTGHAFPNALLLHALADLESLSIDIGHLQRKRGRMVTALREMGYQVHLPEGTFYLLPRSPWPDDFAFVNYLAERDVFCLPGAAVEMPGYFRISLTATDDMIERALPVFAEAAAQQAA